MPSAATLSWPLTSAARTMSANFCMRWIRNCIVFNNGFEGAPGTAMVEFYRIKFRCVKGNSVLHSCLFNQVLFFDEQEFSLWIDESLNQPGAGHAVNFDVFPRNPFHIHLTVATNT